MKVNEATASASVFSYEERRTHPNLNVCLRLTFNWKVISVFPFCVAIFPPKNVEALNIQSYNKVHLMNGRPK